MRWVGVGSGYLRYPEQNYQFVFFLFRFHGAFGLNGNVVRFASTPNEKICHWGVFVDRQGGRLSIQFAIDH